MLKLIIWFTQQMSMINSTLFQILKRLNDFLTLLQSKQRGFQQFNKAFRRLPNTFHILIRACLLLFQSLMTNRLNRHLQKFKKDGQTNYRVQKKDLFVEFSKGCLRIIIIIGSNNSIVSRARMTQKEELVNNLSSYRDTRYSSQAGYALNSRRQNFSRPILRLSFFYLSALLEHNIHCKAFSSFH